VVDERSMSITVLTRRAPWADPLPHQQCNFHGDRRAAAAYAGTPVCDECAARLDGRFDKGLDGEISPHR
jgi:hypothetical protein